MGPYNNNKGKPPAQKLFGQTMRKSNKSSAATRYQRQFGGKSGNNAANSSKPEPSQADEAAARRRLRQEQGEVIDARFGYHRLEDQYQERQKNSGLRTEAGGTDDLVQRRGWVFNMAATTVSYLSPHRLP